jgi:RNA polymerase sigma-70 factor, ECF subfamily
MLHDPVEAEDLVPEVFIQLFRKSHTYRGESAFSTWVHRLTANLVLMRLRKKRPISISLDDITGSEEQDARPEKKSERPIRGCAV